MPLEFDHECPTCKAERSFYRAASTSLHLGQKTKWYCSKCGYGLVMIDGEIDSSNA